VGKQQTPSRQTKVPAQQDEVEERGFNPASSPHKANGLEPRQLPPSHTPHKEAPSTSQGFDFSRAAKAARRRFHAAAGRGGAPIALTRMGWLGAARNERSRHPIHPPNPTSMSALAIWHQSRSISDDWRFQESFRVLVYIG
jgi:hypothetical protein